MTTWYAEFHLTGELGQQQIDAIGDEGGFDAAVLTATGNRHWLTLAVDAADYRQAATAAINGLQALVNLQGAIAAGNVAVETVTVQTEEARDRGLGLIGAQEFAGMLGVTTARLRQLRQERDDFPQPVGGIAATGSLYRREDAEAFAAVERPTGRPRKAA